MDGWRIEAAGPGPLGAHPIEGGTTFRLFSAHAEAVELCLFDGDSETRLRVPAREGYVWAGHVPGVTPGQRYGYRVHGPYAPMAGHRFNPAKLLLDPFARGVEGPLTWAPEMTGDAGGRPDPRDSAGVAPRGIVLADPPDYDGTRPRTPWSETVIYEAHAKGLTAARADLSAPGRLEALAEPPMIAHLQRLGVTAVELLPAQAFLTDGFLVARGLTNFWGYQTLAFFAPHPPYADVEGFRRTVRRLHEAGLEVILDVVYNHTCEGDAGGATLSFRGIDNASYYRLLADGSYDNVTGTGNALNCDSPPVQHLILASLRYWVTKMGVDGFRFDLAATLGRRADGFSTRAALFDAIRADPVLGEVKLIAEPWDIGPGGYNLGGFPYPFAEWNDVFRDTMRRFWRGDAGQAARLADGLTGSARHFDRGDRPATASVNFVTAHDGFTLHDLTAYAARRNEANGEDGRDGHGENWSDAIGGEGATEDAGVRASRVRRMQNLLATLFVAQGTPMILAGDEVANSQGGNNNTYAQDNSTGWVDWQSGEDLTAYVAALAALRRRLPVLRQTRFLHGTLDGDGTPDVLWWHPEGRPMAERDWIDPENRLVMASLRRATASAMSAMPPAFVVLNAGPAVPAQLPEGNWRGVFASHGEAPVPEDRAIKIPAHIVLVYEAEPNT